MKKLKKGYKDTDIGIIPEDWEIDVVGNLASVTTGNKNTQDNKPLGKYPFFVRSQEIEKIDTYSYDGEAVLTAGDGVGTGKVFHYVKGKFDFHQRVYKISDFRNNMNGYYFYLYFSNYFYGQVMQMTAKSSVDSVRREMITKMAILLPPLKEQQAISEALSDIDALISALNKQIEKKKNIKQGAMQELLTGKKRLQGFADKWEEITLEKIAGSYSNRFIDGDWIESPYIVDSGVRLIQTGNIGVGHFKENNNKRFISESSFNLLNCKEIFGGDILICRLAEPAGRACIAPDLKEKMITSVDVTIFRPLESLYDKYFISYIINTDKWFKDIAERCGGTTRTRIARSKLGTVKLILPSTKEEQTAIAQILTDMNNEIEQLEKKRDKYLQIKSGMMQQLLTGQIRLMNTTSCSETQEVEIKNYSTDNKKKHSKQFDEAVIVSFLIDKFGSTTEPLSRFMYTKLSYFIHRKHDCVVVDYKKFAAGPYNPKSRYGGPEKIGKENGYFDLIKDAKGYDAFVPQKNIQEAVDYFTQWYGTDIQKWIEQFRQYKPWDLETLATVDMAINDLEEKGVKATVSIVKTYLSSIPKWKGKLDKPHFSDVHIQRAINESIRLFKI
ncbi:restriction endonuclease subunit S [Dysgonomonas sp. BGC7]|uniref:restriction endonuclease subunit S n=1 Tax=Dysgonomonas sp. BGC7 TaxID=1658008 RepID=UPI000682B7A1|nr:restriction endonuclease subunit S [Dysgonomonas sp. BGC7]MBD8387424.1 restriction endonuclease subunit S [Dysgonomonas sp. BGC7]